MSKYGNKRCNECRAPMHDSCRACGRHDSIREHHRYLELVLLQKLGQIRNLKEKEPVYELIAKVKYAGAPRATPACRYEPDFTYEEPQGGGHWVLVVEDSKGHLTKDFKIKRQLMLANHGIDVRLSA